jgi:hypothetical protein
VAIEDAGFELRDSIAWIYGSGFPKSLDVSKAIDKINGKPRNLSQFTIWFRTTGLTVKQVTNVLRENNLISENGTMASHYFAKSETAQPAIPTVAIWKVLRPLVSDVPEWVDELVARIEAEREVIGMGAATCQQLEKTGVCDGHFDNGTLTVKHQLATAPATPEAQKWQGWGTALKPAFEPVVVGRKPLTGTVAANVLEWGVGGLNIDGTRIPSDDGFEKAWDNPVKTNISSGSQAFNPNTGTTHKVDLSANRPVGGRWPSNVMLDEFTAGLVDQQSGVSKSPEIGSITKTKPRHSGSMAGAFNHSEDGMTNGYGDVGGASRFFYVAKASKRDRNEGLTGLKDTKVHRYGAGIGEGKNPDAPSVDKNFHPTVKPTDLMRNLIRLVTPLGGTVLDPFTGSGSTGKAAILEGMQFVGCELTPEYLPIIEGRINYAVSVKEQEALAEGEKLF